MNALTPVTARAAGMSRSSLYRAVQAGSYERIARGVYLAADAQGADWDQVEAAVRRRDATICLTSALAHHDLVDSIPTALDIAMPRGSRVPAGGSAISWHQFDRATFSVGRDEIPVSGTGLVLGLYSPERSLADAFRLRGEVGYEVARDALREWLRRGGKPGRLIEVATQLPRARGPLLRALEVLT